MNINVKLKYLQKKRLFSRGIKETFKKCYIKVLFKSEIYKI